MISVQEALDHLFTLVSRLDTEAVHLSEAANRILAAPIIAQRLQPPFPASAMDGYALRKTDLKPGAVLSVVGEAPAGRAWDGKIGAGEALRIFTGAPVPTGADFVVIQENVGREGDRITIADPDDHSDNIRPAGTDFGPGDQIDPWRVLTPTDLALAAAMNVPDVVVTRRPVVALLSTGDELVMPGETPRDDQIIASNSFGLRAMLSAAGADVRVLPIARDNSESLRMAIALAGDADLMVTIGGASVGDHDLVGAVAAELGMERAFYKVAMRPGKPLMAGRLGGMAVVGLPGNPVSSMVCGQVFIIPMIHAMLGLGAAPAPRRIARLAIDIGQNGPREHYMRALLQDGRVTPFDRQDSSLLSILSGANALLVRPVADGPRKAGDEVEILPL